MYLLLLNLFFFQYSIFLMVAFFFILTRSFPCILRALVGGFLVFAFSLRLVFGDFLCRFSFDPFEGDSIPGMAPGILFPCEPDPSIGPFLPLPPPPLTFELWMWRGFMTRSHEGLPRFRHPHPPPPLVEQVPTSVRLTPFIFLFSAHCGF